MTHRQRKTGYFVLEGLNAFGTTFFFNYLFFFMHERFGLGNAANLWLSALNGFVYMFAAWFGGQFAQRLGYFVSLRLGFVIMALTLAVGSQFTTVAAPYIVVVVWTLGVCCTWPTLEALVSENETRSGLQRMVGLYNIVWSAGSALAYFTGGALLKWMGMQGLFWLPVVIHLTQLVFLQWLGKDSITADNAIHLPAPAANPDPSPAARTLSMSPKSFLRMAWIANPFAYMAINTVVALMPGLAARLNLSLTVAGFFCSVWFISRLSAFTVLWLWPGWHYRFRWLVGAYCLTLLTFLVLTLVPNLWVGIIAQIVFGWSAGLLYYSSLYYSMDVGETKGEHGGIHEAAIGGGIFVGPAVGAAMLHFYPKAASSGVWTISGLLLVGGCLMLAIRVLQPNTHTKGHER